MAFPGSRPQPAELFALGVSIDERRQCGGAQRVEAALDLAFAHHLPRGDGLVETLHRMKAEIAIFKQTTRQVARLLRYDDGSRRSEPLEASREVRGAAYRGNILAALRQVADDDDAGRDADMHGEIRGLRGRGIDAGDAKRGADRSLGIVLMRARVAEQREHAVADVPRNDATVLRRRSAQRCRYRWITSASSSGSSRTDSAVDATMSQNITVIWRRSAGRASVMGYASGRACSATPK